MAETSKLLFLIVDWPDEQDAPELLPELFDELRRSRVRAFPFPPWPLIDEPWYWDDWFLRFDIEEWDYWLHRWWRRYHHLRDEMQHEGRDMWRRRWRDRWGRELRYVLERIADRHEPIVVLFFVPPADEKYGYELEELRYVQRYIEDAVVVQLQFGESGRYLADRFPNAETLRYPEQRRDLLNLLQSYSYDADRAPAESAQPSDAASTPVERYKGAASAPMEGYDEVPDEVNLGVSTPPTVAPSQSFVARFAAYTTAFRHEIQEKLELEAPASQQRLDLDACRWHRNTRVEVRLQSDTAKVSNPMQSFLWNGAWKILRFDVETFDNSPTQTVILRFDVAVEGLPLVSLRPEIQLQSKEQLTAPTAADVFTEQAAPQTAFASYATRDRREVLSRVRSLQIFTNIDVFLDCLSLRPGDKWKPKLQAEIGGRDIFWLSWSRRAKESEWVDWKWRTALDVKTLNGIQPHPLEPMELAPPPDELSDLQFGTLYKWYISELKTHWISRLVRTNRHRAAVLFGKFLRIIGPRSRPLVRLTVLVLVATMIVALCWMAYSLVSQ